MASTPGGYPYPVGTDKVVDGDNAIKALAEKVDTNPDEVTLSRSVDMTVGTATWAKTVWSAVAYTSGQGLAAAAGISGITAALAGRYWAQGWFQMPSSNPTGRRIIGFGDVALASPPANSQLSLAPAAGALTDRVNFGCPITVAAGVTVAMFVYQDSGVSLIIPLSSLGFTLYRLRK